MVYYSVIIRRTRYGTNSSRQRHDHARDPSSNTAIVRFERGAEPGVGHQRAMGRLMPETVAKVLDGEKEASKSGQ